MKTDLSTGLEATCPAEDLAAALSACARIVPGKTTIPILSHALLRAEAGHLVITTSNLDQIVTMRIPAEVSAHAAITADAKTLADALRKAPKGAQAKLKADGGRGHLQVSYGRSRFRLPTLPAEDFPTFPADATRGQATFAIPAGRLLALFAAVGAAVSTEETRYYLCGVYLHRHGEHLRAVATNGHSLGLQDAPLPAGAEAMPAVILPAALVKTVQSVWAKAEGDLTVTVTPSRIILSGGDIHLESKLIDGTYPDYERVMPKGGDITLAIDSAGLAGAIERVMTVETGKSKALKLHEELGALTLASRDQTGGEAAETLDAQLSGADAGFAIGFNGRYALDALASLAGGTVEVSMSSPGDPMLWRSTADASARWVIMPMRVDL